MKCLKCNYENLDNSKFCQNCGSGFDEIKYEQNTINTKNIVPEAAIIENKVVEKNELKKDGKKKIIIFIIIAVFLLSIVGGYFLFFNKSSKDKKKDNDVAENSGSNGESYATIKTVYYNEGGNQPSLISGNITDTLVNSESDVYTVLDELKSDLNITDAKNEFSVLYTKSVEDVTFYRLSQQYNNIPVVDHDVIISVDKNGKVLSYTGNYFPISNLDTNPKYSKEDSETLIKNYTSDGTIEEINLVIIIYNGEPILAYSIICSSIDDIKLYYVNANTNVIITEDNLTFDAAYNFNATGMNGETLPVILDSGVGTYYIHDPVRKIYITDISDYNSYMALNAFGYAFSKRFNLMNGNIKDNEFIYKTNSDEDIEMAKAAFSALKNFEDIYDFYYNKLLRDSYDDSGSEIFVAIGYNDKGEKVENAMWASYLNIMIIGYGEDGRSYAVSKDVLAHEFTHGVISQTARLSDSPDKNKANESGALNEAIADIFGCIIEGKNWIIGESNNEYMRDIANPYNLETPYQKNGKYYFPNHFMQEGENVEDFINRTNLNRSEDNKISTIFDLDKGGVHHNSTVVSHAAYLMVQYANLSLNELAWLWYKALYYMNPTSTFNDCALAVMQAAMEMGYSRDKVLAIQRAFLETNMLNIESSTVEGKVLYDKYPINNAYIKFENKSTGVIYEFNTTYDGTFEFALTNGYYDVTISKDEFVTYTDTIQIGNYTEMEVQLKSINDVEEKDNGNDKPNNNDKPKNNDLGSVSENMASLNNYDYDVYMVADAGFISMETTMQCKEDRKNLITHCKISVMGFETNQYIDYGNQVVYTNNNGSWEKEKINVTTDNAYVSLANYLKDYKEENKNGGKLITGKITSDRLAESLAQSDNTTDYSGLETGDIDISLFINKDGYLEEVNFSMSMMGVNEDVRVVFKNYNKAGDVSLPKGAK